MKTFLKTYIMRGFWSLLVMNVFLLSACEEDFYPKLEEAESQIVIDAWINNKPEPQSIRITRTLSYFDAVTPPGVQNADVYILDSYGRRYDFDEVGVDGLYVWTPTSGQPQFGQQFIEYNLTVEVDNEKYTASSILNPVGQIDSVRFRLEEGNSFFPESYFAEFFARDLIGVGDTYWIKAWKNGQFLNQPDEINIAFDAGFTAGGNVDGIYFIQPIRDGINPFETDENDEFQSPYEPGDSVYVEVHSITLEAFLFLNELKIQTDRPGGFAELFAVPLSNVPTNIVNQDPEGKEAVGFFCISAVSSKGAWLDPDNLPQLPEN